MSIQEHRSGFSLPTATIFIVGEVGGVGLLSLPHSVSWSGWYGIPMILFCACAAGFSGLYLAKCWLILEERFPKYRQGLTRKPFATIGDHAYGPWMSAFVSIIMNLTRIGATTVIILLISNLIVSLTKSFIHMDICKWAPIVSSVLLLPMFFGSPIDFWPMAYMAMFSTILGSILLLVAIIIQVAQNGFDNHYEVRGFTGFVSSFGTIFFAFGGASAFPNFQNDMRDKSQFPKAVVFGFISLLLLYTPIAGLGFAAFGHNTSSNIIDSLDSETNEALRIMKITVQICFLFHCLSVVLIVINPVFLDLEELMRFPKAFNWKRVLFRTFLMVIVTFIGETFPNFGQILDLIGSSTIAMMAFVLPPIFYMKLCNDSLIKEERNYPLYQKILFATIILSGLAGGISSTYSTLYQWGPLEDACYIQSKQSTTASSTTIKPKFY